MQTFLPFPDYTRSARALDRARLGKQRVEVIQILNVLHEIGNPGGWRNHPAVRMWRGCELQLCEYGLVVCDVWIERGYADTCKPQIEQHLDWAESGDMSRPRWFGDEEFHRSHQSNLLRKAEQHRLVHNDLPHDPHGKSCKGFGCHKQHNNCNPMALIDWYGPLFPGVPSTLPYIWPAA